MQFALQSLKKVSLQQFQMRICKVAMLQIVLTMYVLSKEGDFTEYCCPEPKKLI